MTLSDNGCSPVEDVSDGVEVRLFEFERHLRTSLRRFPLVVRYKLDACGAQIALEDWQRLSLAERGLLVAHPIGTPGQRATYLKTLDQIVSQRCGRLATRIAPAPLDPFGDAMAVPEQIEAQCRRDGVVPISLAQWRGLSPLAHYSLLKLSRPEHRNRGFRDLLMELTRTARAGALLD